MISTKIIVNKANAKIAAGLTEIEAIQLSVIGDSITKSKLVVESIGNLPSAADNKGRLVYISDIDEYYFSDGAEWSNDFNTELQISSAVYARGNNNNGRLGDDTIVNRSSPVTVVGGIPNWNQVSSGSAHSLGVTDDGIAYAWGNNSNGRLGDDTIIDKSSPITVVGGITNWSQLSAASAHSLGVTDDGIAYAWGLNTFGRLGDGTALTKSSPVTVIGGITNWKQLSAGLQHSLGVTDNGIAYAWGLGSFGRLGQETTIDRSSPIIVVGGITNWKQLSAGDAHSIGITDDGIAYAWGSGGSGRLGDDIDTNRSSPVTVVGGITNWNQVSAGAAHSIGITDDGIAYAWGNNTDGRLGDNTTLNKSSPVTVVGGITNWSQVSAGNAHSLGVTDNGIAYAWGSGGDGRLGDDTTINKSSPTTVIGGITNWSQISAGNAHSLVISAILSIPKGFNEP